MHKALLSLGATPVIRRGDGDDDEDIEADFDTWRAELYTTLDDTSDLIAKAKVLLLCSPLAALAIGTRQWLNKISTKSCAADGMHR